MNVSKLKEALFDLQRQRMLIDNAIGTLQKVIEAAGVSNGESAASSENAPLKRLGYVDLTVNLLQESGKPLHVNAIAASISKLAHREVSRAAVESTLIRHMAVKGDRALVSRVSPGTFGLPQWSVLKPVDMSDFSDRQKKLA